MTVAELTELAAFARRPMRVTPNEIVWRGGIVSVEKLRRAIHVLQPFTREDVSVSITDGAQWTMPANVAAALRALPGVPHQSSRLFVLLLLGRSLIQPWPFVVMAPSDVAIAKAWGLL